VAFTSSCRQRHAHAEWRSAWEFFGQRRIASFGLIRPMGQTAHSSSALIDVAVFKRDPYHAFAYSVPRTSTAWVADGINRTLDINPTHWRDRDDRAQ
jgi:hypothetical protein